MKYVTKNQNTLKQNKLKTNINYTRLFVGSGIKEQKNPGDAGNDVYMPQFDSDILNILENRGFKVVINGMSQYEDVSKSVVKPMVTKARIYDKKKLIAIYEDLKWYIFEKINIPVGLAFNLPEGYYAAIDNRSSNFKNNFNVVLGYIDNEYTYGIGAQLFPIDKSFWNIIGFKTKSNAPIVISSGDRIAQIIFTQLSQTRLTGIPVDHFEQQKTVINKRDLRTGGFGSTGK